MTLALGTRVGPYEIRSVIGAGGMGEVYRGHDLRLGRDVALKLLPSIFAQDPDRLARFQREAHLLAALNHPHIATIYGLEESAGVTALAMELVEGPTLADRIEEGPISLDEALAIAKQIAEGLEAAHQHGIVHRDVKPANVKLTEAGAVKLLDFGLAKALDPAVVSVDLAHSPTITSPVMTQGLILGTAAYMAPEQARGKPVDKRADIWAFGVVLFEMLTGRRLFAGEDLTETISLVVKGQPDLGAAPPAVRRLLAKCLEKDPSRRLRDIGDAWELLDTTKPGVAVGPARRPNLLWNGALVLTGIAIGSAIVAVAGGRLASRAPSVNRFVESLVPERSFPEGIGLQTAVAVSPDGRTLAYCVQENGQFRLYRRFLDQVEAERIGDIGARNPFFSPDGQWLGFTVGSAVKRVPIRGGTAQMITDVAPAGIRGADWTADGTILLGGLSRGILRVSENGGEPMTLVKPNAGEALSFPRMLPGGKALLYTERVRSESPRQSRDQITAFDLRTGIAKRILPGMAGRYVPSGHLIFAGPTGPLSGDLWGVAFDADILEMRGTPVPIVRDIRLGLASANPAGTAQFDAIENGTLAYIPAVSQQRSVVWVDRQHREEQVGLEPRPYSAPRVSPDGTRIAVTMRDAGMDVWWWDVGRRTFKQLTSDPGPNFLAAWFPDSTRLAFSMIRDGTQQVFWQSVDGAGIPQALTGGPQSTLPLAISRGEDVLLLEYSGGTNSDIGIVSLRNPKARRALLNTSWAERNAVLSPDGRWLAYESDVFGRPEILVRPFPDTREAEHRITTDGGLAPVWARDGRELFFWKERGTMVSIMSVPVTPGRTFDFGTAQTVIQGRYGRPSTDTPYDVGPDGRFLLLKPLASSTGNEIVIVQNWFEDLKRLVPRN